MTDDPLKIEASYYKATPTDSDPFARVAALRFSFSGEIVEQQNVGQTADFLARTNMAESVLRAAETAHKAVLDAGEAALAMSADYMGGRAMLDSPSAIITKQLHASRAEVERLRTELALANARLDELRRVLAPMPSPVVIDTGGPRKQFSRSSMELGGDPGRIGDEAAITRSDRAPRAEASDHEYPGC